MISIILLNALRLSKKANAVSQLASGTSGMSAAMNGAVNGLPYGWFPEFDRDKIN